MKGEWGEVCELIGDVRRFLGKVHAKTPGLYQVPNWSYGQKTKKKVEMGVVGRGTF